MLPSVGSEYNAGSHTLDYQWPIEMEHPVLDLDRGRKGQGLGPLSHEVSDFLGLDSVVGSVDQAKSHKLHCPFHDPTGGVSVVDNLDERQSGDHVNWVWVEIVNLLARHHEHGVYDINLWESCLGLTQHLTDEVDWAMHLANVAGLRPFNHQDNTNHLGGHGNVEQQWLSFLWGKQYQVCSQSPFHFVKWHLSLWHQFQSS